MAVGEIIGAAIGILMLIIVAYLVVGTTLSTAEIVVDTQKEVTLLNEARLRTVISIFPPSISIINTATAPNFTFCLNNTGSESLGDFPHMDVFSYNSTGYQRYEYDSTGTGGPGLWILHHYDRDFVHPKILNPGEAFWVCATYVGEKPASVLVATGNGVYTSTTIP